MDFNRSGAPLMEIVTEPDIRTAEQARRYAEELQMLLRAIGASDADMERGQMRVEANVSLRPRGTEAFGTRVEVKNMNSFRAVERAIGYEIERQGAALDAGEPLHMETRGWDDARQATYRMRAKETSEDYRYFPEPDLPPLHVEPAWIDRVRAALPELPAARRARYEALGITGYDAAVLVADPGMTGAFEAISAAAGASVPAREVSNFVSGTHARVAKADGLNAGGTAGASTPEGIAELLGAIAGGTRLAPGRARPPGAAPRGRHPGRRAARGRRARAHLGRRLAAGTRRRRDRGQPEGGRRLPRRQAGRRVLRRPGHEGNRRGGGRLPGHHARPRAPRRRRLTVGIVGIALIVAGVALIVVGVLRAREPYRRYMALKEQDANVARYEAWRGGARPDSKTEASVAMQVLRRKAQIGGADRDRRVRPGGRGVRDPLIARATPAA